MIISTTQYMGKACEMEETCNNFMLNFIIMLKDGVHCHGGDLGSGGMCYFV